MRIHLVYLFIGQIEEKYTFNPMIHTCHVQTVTMTSQYYSGSFL